MKLKRRGFLRGIGGILSFGAFEKACMAEAGVNTPIDLAPDVKYHVLIDITDYNHPLVFSHDPTLLERIKWRWTFNRVLETIYSVDGEYWPSNGDHEEAKRKAAIVVKAYPQCFDERGSVTLLDMLPIDKIQKTLKEIGREPDFVIQPLTSKINRSELQLILPEEEHMLESNFLWPLC